MRDSYEKFFEAIIYFIFSSTTPTIIRHEHVHLNHKTALQAISPWQRRYRNQIILHLLWKLNPGRKKQGSICWCCGSSISGDTCEEFMSPAASGPSCSCLCLFCLFCLFCVLLFFGFGYFCLCRGLFYSLFFGLLCLRVFITQFTLKENSTFRVHTHAGV